MAHAASAFFPSPFPDAAILTMDGVGEWATTTVGRGSGASIELERELHFPHSIGLLYSAFTYYTGFKVNSGEYKVMGLAPYGEPKYASLIFDNLIDVRPDGTFRLNLEYFDYCTGLTMTNHKFDDLFGGALGAALVAYHLHRGQPRRAISHSIDGMNGSYLGPSFSQQECEARLKAAGAKFAVVTEDEMIDSCATALAEGKALGWFQDRM